MLDFSHLPTSTGASNVQVFTGNSVTAGGEWQTWVKPRGKTMLNIVLFGKGGNGGKSNVGTDNASGGGSGGLTIVTIPLALLPDRLFLSLAGQSSTTTLASYIAIATDTIANNTVAYAAGGGNGVDGVNLSGQAGGTAASAATAALMPLGWSFQDSVLAGQVGGASTSFGLAPDVTIPVTGIRVTGGTGGTGSGSATASGIVGGGDFPTIRPPPNVDTVGFGGPAFLSTLFFYGGVGGQNCNTSAFAGLAGGAGAFGCGGGGASTDPALNTLGGSGGPALAILTCW